MSTDAANELLMGRPKVRSAKFPDGEYRTVVGTIVRPPEVMQQRKYRKDGQLGDLEFWDDGRPKMQVAVHVQTTEREDAEDDGIRAFYLRWKIADAVKAAVLAVGAKGLEVGGTLAVKHVSGDGNDPKEWAAQYRPPVSNGAADDLLMSAQPTNGAVQQAVAAAPASVTQAFPTAAPAQVAVDDGPPAGAPEGIKATWNTLDAATRALLRQQFPGF